MKNKLIKINVYITNYRYFNLSVNIHLKVIFHFLDHCTRPDPENSACSHTETRRETDIKIL